LLAVWRGWGKAPTVQFLGVSGGVGALLWSYATGNGVNSSPAVVNGVVYVSSYDGNVYALNASTGALLWSYYQNWARRI
jgi:outer membrane protein assembly factor BamB